MTQTIQHDKNPSAEGAAARVSRVAATPSLSTDTFTSWPPSGTYSHRLIATATTIATMGLPNADRPAAAAGETWSVTAQVRSVQARTVALSIVFYNTAGATLGTALSTTSDTDVFAAGEIRTMRVDGAVAPASTASVDVQVSRTSGVISDSLHVDMVALTKTAAGVPYRDPATVPLATWTGTAHASTQIYWDPAFTLTGEPLFDPPCINVQLDDLPPAITSLTLTRTAAGRTHKVRGAIDVAVASGYSILDVEAPFDRESSYRAELFDSGGLSLGFTSSAAATLDVTDECWVHNPLDPAGATRIDIADTSGKAIVRPIRGARYTPEQRPLGVLITSMRGGVEGAELFFSTDDDSIADKFEAMFGGYEEDDQLVPVIVIRAPRFLDLPAPFYAGALQPVRKPINVHMGGALREWDVTADETEPPFAGIVVALLTRNDIDAAFASRNALDAYYSSRLAIDRDYAKAGTAP